jgi:hypothetical protein
MLDGDFFSLESMIDNYDIDPKFIAQFIERKYSSPILAINQEIRRKNGTAAAAAGGFHHNGFGTSSLEGGGVTSMNSSDPWDYSLLLSSDTEEPIFSETSIDYEDNIHDTSVCVCRQRRNKNSFFTTSYPYQTRSTPSTSTTKPNKRENNGYDDDKNTPDGSDNLKRNICSRCGKLRVAGLATYNLQNNRSPNDSFHNTGSRQSIMESHFDNPNHAEALLQSTPQLRFLAPSSTNMQGNGTLVGSTNIFLNFVKPLTEKKVPDQSTSSGAANGAGAFNDYCSSLIRNRADKQAAAELASLLWLLAHEMSIEDYGTVESEVFKLVFALVHSRDTDRRMAGLAALDALLSAPSADEEKKSIKFANTLSNGLRSANGDYEFVSAVSQALGHMAMRTANVDFVESEVTRSLEWLRTDRSDRR